MLISKFKNGLYKLLGKIDKSADIFSLEELIETKEIIMLYAEEASNDMLRDIDACFSRHIRAKKRAAITKATQTRS